LRSSRQARRTRSLQEIVDEGVRRAWREERNPLRASVVSEPLFGRRNRRDVDLDQLTRHHLDVEHGRRVVAGVAAPEQRLARIPARRRSS
jgi:fumarate hydratase class I